MKVAPDGRLPAPVRAAAEGRVGIGWRAVGVRDGDTMIWFWIGSHADYDRVVKKR